MTKRLCPRCHRYYPATRAECPTCGPPWWRRALRLPGGRPSGTDINGPALIAGGALLIALAVGGLIDTLADRHAQARTEQAARTAETAARKTAACRHDAHCWGQRHLAAATSACIRRVDRSALHATRWPSGLLNPEFLAWEWRDETAGTLVYVGCLYDPGQRSAIDIELNPGRL